MPDAGQPPGGLSVEPGDGGRRLRVSGELDISTAADLEKALREHLEGEGDGDLVLDLAGLSFMDSSGIKVLTNAARDLDGKGRLILESPGPAVKRVLELTKLTLIKNLEVRG